MDLHLWLIWMATTSSWRAETIFHLICLCQELWRTRWSIIRLSKMLLMQTITWSEFGVEVSLNTISSMICVINSDFWFGMISCSLVPCTQELLMIWTIYKARSRIMCSDSETILQSHFGMEIMKCGLAGTSGVGKTNWIFYRGTRLLAGTVPSSTTWFLEFWPISIQIDIIGLHLLPILPSVKRLLIQEISISMASGVAWKSKNI